MRKWKTVIACMLSISMLAGMSMSAGATFNRSYTAPKGTPILDGEIDDIWSTAEWTDVDKIWDTVRDTDSALRIKLLWDDSNLYFLAAVYDTQLNKRNDIVEIYLDQNNNKSAEYGEDDTHTRFYVAGGVVKGEASGANAQTDAPSAVKSLGDNRYIVEGAISWPVGTPSVGAEMGLEFMYNDGTKYIAFLEAYRWNVDTANGDEPPYASTEYFGTLILADAGTIDSSVSAEDPFEGMDIPAETEDPSTGTEEPSDVKEPIDSDEPSDVKEPTNTDEPSETKKDSANWTYIIIAIAAIGACIVVGLVVCFQINKKRKAN